MRGRARSLGATELELIRPSEILERDGLLCHICGKDVAVKDVTMDHVLALVLGGQHTRENLKVAHRSCNASKGNREKKEARAA